MRSRKKKDWWQGANYRRRAPELMGNVVMGGGEGGRTIGVGLCLGRHRQRLEVTYSGRSGFEPGPPAPPPPGQISVDCDLPSESTSRFPRLEHLPVVPRVIERNSIPAT